ncbi:hypothetical protein BYT27DRAFT_7207081 [Phlegmacium glaucopus]|nr:hypothetical protein BYT27DRAFT_7207081 [Phlegmacium glaucopus]
MVFCWAWIQTQRATVKLHDGAEKAYSSLAFKRVIFWVSWGFLLLKIDASMIVAGIEVGRKYSDMKTFTSYSEKSGLQFGFLLYQVPAVGLRFSPSVVAGILWILVTP